MACPTCSATMHAMGCKISDRDFFWCPRCGTIKSCDADVGVPMLVERCREFGKMYLISNAPRAAWKRLGIAESIARKE